MRDIDLNLLRLVVTLEKTRHLGRAAERLQMSQSGFSTALSRLREQLGDELFVRSGAGMRPTPRAESLAETARKILQLVESDVLGATRFEPESSSDQFVIAMSDVGEVVFMPTLIQHLATRAPGLSIKVAQPALIPMYEQLASGEIDLAVGYFPALEKDAFFRQPLLSHTYACIVRSDHPLVSEGLTLNDYQALGHAVIAAPARSNMLLEQMIEQQHIQRRVVLTTPHHLSLPATVARTDLIASVPLGTAVDFACSGQVAVLPLPFDPPSFTIYQYWHRRTHREPGHQWLRTQMKTLFNQGRDPYAHERKRLYG